MIIPVKLCHSAAIVPRYHSAGAACFDIHAVESGRVYPGRSTTFATGLMFEVPPGHVLLVYSRSGYAFNHAVRLANSVGVIDSDYRGEVLVKLTSDAPVDDAGWLEVRAGDRIAQGMVLPVERVGFSVTDVLNTTARGSGGFGSTGVAQ